MLNEAEARNVLILILLEYGLRRPGYRFYALVTVKS